MGACPEDPGSFHAWSTAKAGYDTTGLYMSRILYGDYLTERLDNATANIRFDAL